ncbi:MAG TPA: DUF6067 family protein, partial [Planctomycetota bacterium]|nr:DUF6067 family protein [Planctomycetota bacterium]
MTTGRMAWLGAFAVVLLAVPATAGQPPKAAPAAAESGADVLNMTSYWRWHTGMKPPEYSEGGKLVPLKPPSVWGIANVDRLDSPVPPDDWAGADFDDSSWPRSRLEWCRRPAFSRYSTSRVFFRGKFAVTDPEGAKLKLSFTYVGGVVVYVNGQELCRASLPSGKLEADAPAEVYPDDAFVGKNGKPIPSADRVKKASGEDKAALEAGIAKRTRTLAPVEIPAKLLRKGTNVLAIEVRRAPYHPSSLTWFAKSGTELGAGWITAGIDGVRLSAGGAGAVPNTSRPAGLQLWNQDRCDRVALADYGDPNERLQPVRIFGARNGHFCGQLALGSTEALTGIGVTATALKGAKGEIPAANVAALFGVSNGMRGGPWFLNLAAKPPAQVAADKSFGGAVQEILLRVRIPKDAAAGAYKGTVTVSASGKQFEVPLEVNVSDWTLPDPTDYRTYVGIYQSPISVAMQYSVQPWSDEHWKLMEKSFELLGRIGNKMINVSVVDETQFGEPEGMINWVKKADGTYDYDFAIFDRYLALATKHCGKLDYVCFQVWHAGGWEARPVDNKCTVT